MNILFLVILTLTGYLLGSINTSILVSGFCGTDIRGHGSGNAGATNTLRALGKKAAIFVLIGDVLKGLAAVWLVRLAVRMGMEPNKLYEYAAGLAAVLGHNYPIYFGFRGGKGILTTAAVLAAINWPLLLIVLAIFVAVTAVTRYVSLGSIIASVALPIAGRLMTADWLFTVFCVCVALLAIYRHRANIVRLLHGEEHKLSFKPKQH